MSDERIKTLVGIPPKELDMLRRKAAAFEAMVTHEFTLFPFVGKWKVYDGFHRPLTTLYATPLEAVEAAIAELEKT